MPSPEQTKCLICSCVSHMYNKSWECHVHLGRIRLHKALASETENYGAVAFPAVISERRQMLDVLS